MSDVIEKKREVARKRALGFAFLDSLFPAGEHCYLGSHARSFLEGRLGHKIVVNPNDDQHQELARVLREIVESLEVPAYRSDT